MRLTAVRVTDFKRVREVALSFPESGLVLLGGPNAAGKSSVLDALLWAFGGASYAPADPVRHGAEKAEVHVDVSDGASAYRIRRWQAAGKKPALKVVRVIDGEELAVQREQEALDRLVGARFLDPVAFLSCPPAARRAKLVEVLGLGDQLDALDVERKARFEERAAENRRVKEAEGKLPALAPGDPPAPGPAPVDVADLARQQQAAAEVRRANDARRADERRLDELAQAASRRNLSQQERVDELTRQLAGAHYALDATRAEESRAVEAARGATVAVAALVDPDTELLDLALSEASGTNRRAEAARIAAESYTRRKERHEDEQLSCDQAKAASEALTARLAAIDAEKLRLVETADLPVPGLGLAEGDVTYQGLPLSQASGAEGVRVSLAIAAAAQPSLTAIWCKQGALLDDDGLATVAAWAEERDFLVVLERVGKGDEGAIIIEDGGVAGG